MDNLLRLRLNNTTPPGGWRCVCPGTDVPVSGGDRGDLIEKCEALLVSLGKPAPLNLPELVEDAICRAQPLGSHYCKPRKSVARTITLRAVWRFLNTLVAWSGQKLETVEQEEAERRAMICKNCPMQVEVAGCWGCKGIGGMVEKLKGEHKTAADAALKTCNVCGCYNAVQIWVPLDVLRRASEELEYPEWCWKRDTAQ